MPREIFPMPVREQGEPQADSFLDGRLRLHQPETGHRVGADALLLAACTPPHCAGPGVDIGAGVGGAGLAALIWAKNLTMTLVEIDAPSTALARRNIVQNGYEARASAVEADFLKASARRVAGLKDGAAALILTNPPFYKAGAVRISPDSDKARAHVASVSIESWMKNALALLAPGGLFCMIHRPDALAEILCAASGRIGALAILPVLPLAQKSATRILVGGIKGNRAPLKMLPPLILHGADGGFTAQADAVFRGRAGLALFPPPL